MSLSLRSEYCRLVETAKMFLTEQSVLIPHGVGLHCACACLTATAASSRAAAAGNLIFIHPLGAALPANT